MLKTWTSIEAFPIILVAEPIARKYGMSIALGGSVSQGRWSDNDLDLIVFNLKTSIKPDHISFINELVNNLNFKIWGVVDHSKLGDEKLVYKLKTQDNKRVDLLFVNLLFKDKMDGVEVLTRKTDYKKL